MTTDIKSLALGRILRLGARPAQPGDIEEYERCRAIVMADAGPPDFENNYARDRLKGAQGD
jgi:superfamily II DNA or RNA helicase